MNPLHLLWIVPVSFIFGFAICAVLSIANLSDEN